jgi:uncharacterized protein (TIGR00255 family)
MTGFGEAHSATESLAVSVEVRAINNRHFKLSLRSSEGYAMLEPQIDALVRAQVRRGTVQVNLRVRRSSTEDDYQINAAVLRGYRRQLDQLTSVLGPSDPVPFESLLSLPGVVEQDSVHSAEPDRDWPAIKKVLTKALLALSAMRRTEGQALLADLRQNCRTITEAVDAIEKRSPIVADSYRDRLVDRVNRSLAELNVSVQPAELIREVSLFIDRSDISEEIVRLRSHLEQFESALQLDESSGRKLEFIVQEMGRETNTIGSKANDVQISQHVVEMKTALERIREQVQNVE